MDIIGQILATSGLGVLGNLAGGIIQNQGASSSVQQQEQFQEQMSNTAYQRAVSGMEAAGLNPALAYSQGPASAPAGASYTPTNVLGGAVQGGIGAASTAAQTITQAQQIENLKSQNTNIQADTAAKIAAAATSTATAKKIAVDTTLAQQDIPEATSGAQAYKDNPWLGKVEKFLNVFTGGGNGTHKGIVQTIMSMGE